MLDHMAEVDDPRFLMICHVAIAPMSSQMTLRVADGIARCHQPLMMKPTAPKTFIHWYAADCPVRRPVDSRK